MNKYPLLLQNYINQVLVNFPDSKSTIEYEQVGLFYFNKNAKATPFTARQEVSILKPEFSWKARMNKFFLPCSVNDRLVDGVGALEAKIFSFIPVANISNDIVLKGELLRYLAELPWFPIAFTLLPGLEFSEVDERHIKVSCQFRGVLASVIFEFNNEGLISSVTTNERSMIDGKKIMNYPWGGTFSNYQLNAGMLIPTHAEVFWDLPEGRFTYFKCDLTKYTIKN